MCCEETIWDNVFKFSHLDEYAGFNLLSLCLQNVKLIVPVVVLMLLLIVIVLGVVYMMRRVRYGAFCCINPVSRNYNFNYVWF